MARYQLIDDYLDDVAYRLRWRPDCAALIDELGDHLYSSVEFRLVGEHDRAVDRPGTDAADSTGISVDNAQRQTLAHFGSPGDIAMDFATSGTHGLAVPTSFTVSSGQLAPFVALGWVGSAALFAASNITDHIRGSWEGPSQWMFMLATVMMLLAALLTVVLVVALIRRHGGLGLVGHLGVALAALGTAATFISWFVAGWAGLIGVGAMVIGGAMLRRGLTPRLPTILLGVSWPAAAVTWLALRLLEVGNPDSWNNYQVPVATAICVGAAGYATALFGLGRWLAGEDPVTADTATAMALSADRSQD